MKKIAFVTGATSGIGEAIARILAPDHALIICGRRKERLDRLATELNSMTEVYPLTFDVSKAEEVNEAIGSLPAEWKEVAVLVNNAGNAHGLDPIENGSLDDWDAMIDINVKGLLYVSKAVLPKA